MRNKSFCLLLAGIICLLVLRDEVYASWCPKKNIKTSIQRFITQFNKDLVVGDKSKIKQSFLDQKETMDLLKQTGPMLSGKSLGDESLDWMIGGEEMLAETLEKVEIVKMNTLSEKPLIIEVVIREWHKPGNLYGNDKVLYVLKGFRICKWEIAGIIAQGLP